MSLESLRQDVRQAARSFRRMPSFTLLSVATLAIGVGANAAIWSVTYPLVLSPLGYPNEERIVRVWPEHRFTRERFELYRDETRSFASFSAYVPTQFTLTGDGPPQLVSGLLVSSGHFPAFGIEPHLGRAFESRDTATGSEPVAIVSHRAWLEWFGGSPDVLGRRIDVGGTEGARRTIVGVAPRGFRPLGLAHEIWVPLTFDATLDSYSHMANLGVIARLEANVTVDQARAELATIASSSEPAPYYIDKVSSYTVQPFRDVLVQRAKPTLMALLSAAAAVLILSCANVVNLLLVRNGAREGEVSVRRALGASTSRLVWQFGTENIVLGLLGAGAGIGMFAFTSPLIRSAVPSTVPRATELAYGLPVVAICAVLTLSSALLFGLLPVLRVRRDSVLAGRGLTPGASRARWNRALVSLEIALSFVLVVASGLLAKSLIRLQQVDAGFDSDRVMTLRISPSTLKYDDDAKRVTYYGQVIDALRAVPSVDSVGAVQILPMTPSFMGVGYSPTGATPVPDGTSPPNAMYLVVSPEYRETLRIPLLRGRDLTHSDRVSGVPVGLVNETLARELYPGEDPIGRTVHYEDGSEWFRIVGVVGDVRQRLARIPQPSVYVPYMQDGWPSTMSLVVRTDDRVRSIETSLRNAVWSVDPDVPIAEERWMDDVVDLSLSAQRLRTGLFSLFSVLAFALSAGGVYGVISAAVQQRRREIGVRMALGASGLRVLAETLLMSLRPVFLGLALGVLLTLFASESLSTFLYAVDAKDPIVYGGGLVTLALVAVAASLVPARRASRVDPAGSLNVDG